MTPQTLSTAKELNSASVGTVIIDSDGHAWQKGSQTETVGGGMRSSWTHAIGGEIYSSESLDDGSAYEVVYTLGQANGTQKSPQREYVTQTDLVELSDVPIGTVVKDKDEHGWVKAYDGWVHSGDYAILPMTFAPYTVAYTPAG